MQVTGQFKAFVGKDSYLTPADLQNPKYIASFVFWGDSMIDYAVKNGYTVVGTATITVDLVDEKTLVSNKIEALHEEAKSLRADTVAQCTRIESMIQNLLAIEDRTSKVNVFASPAEEYDIPF